MARHEAPREDLMREATAYRRRMLVRVAGRSEPVFVGLRDGGGISFYFGEDPVYHFAAARGLRRAFVEGRLLKAERGRLVALDRRRTPQATELVREELGDEAQAGLLRRIDADLGGLLAALQGGAFEIEEQLPVEEPLVGEIAAWLAAAQGRIAVADRANA